jgi:hypothetical protein
MKQWDIRITAPNGADSHLAVDENASDDAILEHVRTLLTTVRENDPEPFEGTTVEQPLKPGRK